MDNPKKLSSVLSFCSGYGGIERGLDLAGVEHRVIAYVEIEAFAIANLVKKMEDGKLHPAPIYTDLKTFPSHLFRGHVDIITGGYPCQPFSAAGKRLGAEDPRHLWPFLDHHIAEINPRRVFFENVEGHITLGLETVIGDLAANGYTATWGIFSAREVGAPHQRKRVYIMADSKGERVQGLRASWVEEPYSHGGETLSVRTGEGLGASTWDAEPDVVRVVDGCADRVDRIRLLGNGVVPATAAKAWQVLSEQLNPVAQPSAEEK